MIDYIEVDDNGVQKTISKLEKIKEEMQSFLDNVREQREANNKRAKPLAIKWNTRISRKLESVLLKLELPVSNNEAQTFKAEQFYKWYIEYSDLICFIEETANIPYNKTKPEFCNFCGITGEAFEFIKINGDMYQREALDDIDNRILNDILSSAENAEIKARPAMTRMTAKSPVGHRLQTTTNNEPKIVIPISASQYTPPEEFDMPEVPKKLKNANN